MKLAFHGATTMTSDLETDVIVSAGAGFSALEVWAAKLDRFLERNSLTELNTLFKDHNVSPLALNSIEFIAFRGSEFTQIQARLHALGRIAQAIGCPTVIVVPSPLPDRNISWDSVVTEYVKVLRDLSDIANTYGIKLSFEFLGFGWCSVRTPRAAYQILQQVDRDNVGLTLDAAHFFCGGGLMTELDQLDAQSIFAFHLDDLEDLPKEALTDAHRLLPGKGIIPLDEICKQLNNIGFNGTSAVELFRPEYWEWDPQKLADKAYRAASVILSPYFQIEATQKLKVQKKEANT